MGYGAHFNDSPGHQVTVPSFAPIQFLTQALPEVSLKTFINKIIGFIGHIIALERKIVEKYYILKEQSLSVEERIDVM